MYGSFPPLSSDKHIRGKNQWSKSSVCTLLYWTKAKENIFRVLFSIFRCVLLLLYFGFLLLKSVWKSKAKACMCVYNIFCDVLFFQPVVWGKIIISVFHDEIPVVCTVNTIAYPIPWLISNNNNRVVRRKKNNKPPLTVLCVFCEILIFFILLVDFNIDTNLREWNFSYSKSNRIKFVFIWLFRSELDTQNKRRKIVGTVFGACEKWTKSKYICKLYFPPTAHGNFQLLDFVHSRSNRNSVTAMWKSMKILPDKWCENESLIRI